MDKHIIIKRFLFLIISIIFFISGCVSFDQQVNSKCIIGDCENGFGIRRYDRADYIYIGEWKNGKRNGKGTLTSNSYFDSKSHGIWRDNKFIEGTVYAKDGNYKINYINNEIVGEYVSNLTNIKYQGKFTYYGKSFQEEYATAGRFDIPYYPFILKPFDGQIIWENGDTYKGKFGCIAGDFQDRYREYCGYPSGQGVFTSADGRIYEGLFSIKKERKGGRVLWTGSIANNSIQTKFELEVILEGIYSKVPSDPVINYKIKLK